MNIARIVVGIMIGGIVACVAFYADSPEVTSYVINTGVVGLPVMILAMELIILIASMIDQRLFNKTRKMYLGTHLHLEYWNSQIFRFWPIVTGFLLVALLISYKFDAEKSLGLILMVLVLFAVYILLMIIPLERLIKKFHAIQEV